jgi:wyosine [tRNA(Phe)-imidazoG37] synthetase (radical SAM superfamily)
MGLVKGQEVMGLVYGPVMSWRFGRSLGIDPVPPPKRCTFNCVYCQLGPTNIPVKTISRWQHELPDKNMLQNDLEQHLRQLSVDSLDVVTISGSGEPTINLGLATMVRQIREQVSGVPVVLLTNGSLLGNLKVLKSLKEFDIVTIKFDAGDNETHRLINRPFVSFQHDQLVKGIQKLRKVSSVTIALEVMLLELDSGISNVHGAARESLQRELTRLAPVVDFIQLYTPWRPTGDDRVNPISKFELMDFASNLREDYAPERIWIYGIHDARRQAASWKSHQSLRNELLTMLQRRPCRLKDLTQSLDIPIQSLVSLISQLRRTNQIITKQHQNEVFYFTPI